MSLASLKHRIARIAAEKPAAPVGPLDPVYLELSVEQQAGMQGLFDLAKSVYAEDYPVLIVDIRRKFYPDPGWGLAVIGVRQKPTGMAIRRILLKEQVEAGVVAPAPEKGVKNGLVLEAEPGDKLRTEKVRGR